MAQARHFLGVDGLRGIAILMVIAYHTATLGELSFGVRNPSPLSLATSGGWMGVTLFFVISGFLITGILLDSRGSEGYFRTFFARRALRIFPVYYVTLAIVLLVLPMLNLAWLPATWEPTQHWLSLVLFVPNLDMAMHQQYISVYLDQVWSLGVEEQFYLTWPLVVLWLGPRRLAKVCAGLIGVALIWRATLALAGAHLEGLYFATPSHVDALAVGAGLAVWWRHSTSLRGRFAKLAMSSAPWIGAAILACIAVVTGTLSNSSSAMQVLGLSAVAVLSGGLLLATLTRDPASPLLRVLEFPLLKRIGKHSYAMYLLHELCVIGVVRWLGLSGLANRILDHPGLLFACMYIGAVGAAYALAWCMWHLFEGRILQLKRFFAYGGAISRADLRLRPALVEKMYAGRVELLPLGVAGEADRQ